MQFDFVNLVGFGVLVGAAILLRALHRRYRSGAVEEEDEIAVDQREDVLRAIKSMRKD